MGAVMGPACCCRADARRGPPEAAFSRQVDQLPFAPSARWQGGFVWDWADQALTKRDSQTGQEYWAYGGDFGESHHDAQVRVREVGSFWGPR